MGYQKSKNATMERAGKRISQIVDQQERMHFFGKEDCAKCTGKSNAGRKSRKGLSA
jgi:hypothetical protein